MTYYKIMKYLKKNGLPHGKADYVRGMIRKLVNDGPTQVKNNCGMCNRRGCKGGCYDY